jgi:ABC-2 type transport system permease protein
VLCAALVITQYDVGYRFLPLLPLALVVLVIVSSTFAVFLSALNVHLRDTGHFVELGLLAWFWLTPIIYPYMLIADKLGSKQWMALLNPVTSVVIAFQRAIYNQTTSVSEGTVTKILPVDAGFWWYAKNLAVVGGISLVLFTLALAYFGRVEGDFAEEL